MTAITCLYSHRELRLRGRGNGARLLFALQLAKRHADSRRYSRVQSYSFLYFYVVVFLHCDCTRLGYLFVLKIWLPKRQRVTFVTAVYKCSDVEPCSINQSTAFLLTYLILLKRILTRPYEN